MHRVGMLVVKGQWRQWRGPKSELNFEPPVQDARAEARVKVAISANRLCPVTEVIGPCPDLEKKPLSALRSVRMPSAFSFFLGCILMRVAIRTIFPRRAPGML